VQGGDSPQRRLIPYLSRMTSKTKGVETGPDLPEVRERPATKTGFCAACDSEVSRDCARERQRRHGEKERVEREAAAIA
jgi:hypothetical protein